MNRQTLTFGLLVLLTRAAGAQLTPPPATPVPAVTGQELVVAPGEGNDDTMEPMLRGPIHEAFAEPVQVAEDQPFVVPTAPPEPIEEVAPELKLEQQGAVWIPGYWSWDDDRRDYIWVSGVWRIPPQGRTWMPGHWEQVPGGFRWIAGSWLPGVAAVPAAPMPLPPPSLERGPTSQPVSDDYFWIPGCWQYQQTRYVWRPGFWSPCQNNWVWVPDYYLPVPGGCVYVPGYWDYAWEQRGMLYAPCTVNRVALRPGYVYRPMFAVDLSNAFFHLWVRPNYTHYYFGDYYNNSYAGLGFTPWHRYHAHHQHAYDPLYVHYSWRYGREHVNLYQQMSTHHQFARDHVESRPPVRFDHRDVHHGGPNPRPIQGQAPSLALPVHEHAAQFTAKHQRERMNELVRMSQTGARLNLEPGVNRSHSDVGTHDLNHHRSRVQTVDPSQLRPRGNHQAPVTTGGNVATVVPTDPPAKGTRQPVNTTPGLVNQINPRAIPVDGQPGAGHRAGGRNPRAIPNVAEREVSKPETPALPPTDVVNPRRGRELQGFGRRGAAVDAVVPPALQSAGAGTAGPSLPQLRGRRGSDLAPAVDVRAGRQVTGVPNGLPSGRSRLSTPQATQVISPPALQHGGGLRQMSPIGGGSPHMGQGGGGGGGRRNAEAASPFNQRAAAPADHSPRQHAAPRAESHPALRHPGTKAPR